MAATASNNTNRVHALPLALAFGIVWGLALLALGIVTIYTDEYAHKIVELFGNIYYGFGPGWWGGAFIGLTWGFADAFVGTLIVI